LEELTSYVIVITNWQMEAEERRSIQEGPRSGSAKDTETTFLVRKLEQIRDAGTKSNVRSTDYYVELQKPDASTSRSAVVQEPSDDDDGLETETTVPSDSVQKIRLTSWKTQEFAYRKTTRVGLHEDSELPTLARGLFTTEEQGRSRIVVRGYDKFFNVGEMHWTRPESIAAFSCPPYELSFKENGCIIFIAALSPTQLIVTSKHSLGSNESHAVSHAQKGEEWLDRHLESRGRSKRELAAELWTRNETAVAELCDDNFEEHVLVYPADRSGLHLHGLNANQAQFRTRSMEEVETFAHEWGFLPTRYIVMSSLQEVERFCHTVAQSGSWQGVPIEGFVVRTRLPDSVQHKQGITAPPYQPRQTWFYKVKFDEPYLMYRDWRELTRKMLSDKAKFDKARGERGSQEFAALKPTGPDAQVPDSSSQKSKAVLKKEVKKAEQARKAMEIAAGITPPDPPQGRSGRPETKLYIKWCYAKLYGNKDLDIQADASLFVSFQYNKGIIKLRETFLDYLRSSSGLAQLEQMSGRRAGQVSQLDAAANTDIGFTKTVLVPIAIPGCGKTALALSLKQLIPDLGHTQSDNVQTRKTGPTFLRNILSELDKHDIVFADRNNHLFKHRDEIVDSIRTWESVHAQERQKVRIVAVAWCLDALPLNALHHICSERIVKRGENHQSLRSSANKEHEQILWNFLRQLQPFGSAERGAGEQGHGDAAFDHIIRLDVNDSLESNLSRTYAELAEMLQLLECVRRRYGQAVKAAEEYRVSVRKEVKGAPIAPVRYYGLSINADLPALLAPVLSAHVDARSALKRLTDSDRMIRTPHVTLIHSMDLQPRDHPNDRRRQDDAQRRWDVYATYAKAQQPPVFDLSCDLMAWDDKAVALGAFNVRCRDIPDFEQLQASHWRPHITLGTFSEDIRPYEANRVLRDADAGRPSVSVVRFDRPIHFTARVKGLS
jgi:tRNA ligase